MKTDFPEIQPYLINARWMKPLDEQLLAELKNNVDTIFTIEENCLIGGFGDSIKSWFVNSRVNVHSFGIPDQFVTYGKIDELKNLIGLSTEQIYDKIKSLLS